MKSSRSIRSLAIAAAIGVLAIAAVSAGPALAAKGGNGHGKGGQTTSAVVTVSPDPVPAYGWYTWSGSGFLPDRLVYVSGCGGGFLLFADASGQFYTGNTAGSGGTCTYYFTQNDGHKDVLMFTLSMTVSPE